MNIAIERKLVTPASGGGEGLLPGVAVVSVVVPLRDEEPNPAELVAGICAAMQRVCAHEIVLVDDASTDGTRRHALALAEILVAQMHSNNRFCQIFALFISARRHVASDSRAASHASRCDTVSGRFGSKRRDDQPAAEGCAPVTIGDLQKDRPDKGKPRQQRWVRGGTDATPSRSACARPSTATSQPVTGLATAISLSVLEQHETP
ncbi:glycosyl transferase family 2 [Rhodobacter viridis]|uniref:Glycosyl transferase family 2 n=1 Tax=Rhodobacter viridis TaxID=1054202 RepID=A0A318U040_9RHOB|nr:glycosyltransferase [Rhodobacter viridis]PYF07765.1 glycosyl transferase family 2 [Rhodobacter viridis]